MHIQQRQLLRAYTLTITNDPVIVQGKLEITSVCNHDNESTTTTPQPFYGHFSRTTWVSRCQKRTSGLYGARED